jgi:hypothetical protein
MFFQRDLGVAWKPPVEGPAGLGADEQQGGLCLNLIGAVPFSQLLPTTSPSQPSGRIKLSSVRGLGNLSSF